MAKYDDINTGMIATVGFVSTVATFAIIVGAQVLYFQYQDFEKRRKQILAPISQSETHLSEQKELLSSLAWEDKEAGTVRVPIEKAMDEVLEELSTKHTH